MNRERWLQNVAASMHPLFNGYKIPKYRITCGWPTKNALSKGAYVLGQCFCCEASTDGHYELFITPRIDKVADVLGTVAHELCHAVIGVEHGHGKEFVKICNHIGLTSGRPTSAGPNASLSSRLLALAEPYGGYPHRAIVPQYVKKEKKPISTVHLTCKQCECKVTISKKWLAKAGLPTCGCKGVFVEKE